MFFRQGLTSVVSLGNSHVHLNLALENYILIKVQSMAFPSRRGGCLNRHGNRNGELGQISDTDIDSAQAEKLSTAPRIAMQGHRRPPIAQLHNLHLAPGYAMETCTQGLTDRFLGGKAAGQTRGPHHPSPAALLGLFFGEDAPQKTLAMFLEDFAHPAYFDDIDTNGDIDALGWMEWRGQACHSCGSEKPVGKSRPWLAYQGRKQQGQIVFHKIFTPSVR